jgi:formylglycine-generating enzyme required for sulfatase activity
MLSLWMALGCLGRLWAQELTVREIPELTLSSAPGWTERLEWMASDVSAPSWSVPQDPPDRVTNSLRWVDRSRQRSIGFYRTVVTGWDATTLIQSIPTHEPSGSRRPAGFVWIAPGLFTMGSPAGEPGRGTNEVRRSVLLTRGFWMSDHEVTQSEYRGLMGRNPSGFPGDDRPVENVSWTDAVAYCEALNRKASGLGELPPGHAYRLPTEAE